MKCSVFLYCVIMSLALFCNSLSGTPTEKNDENDNPTTVVLSDDVVTATEVDVTTEVILNDLNPQPTGNSSYRQDEDDESSEEEKEKNKETESEEEGPPPPPFLPHPAYPYPGQQPGQQNLGQPGQLGQVPGQLGQPGQPGQLGQPGQYGQLGQPGQYGQLGQYPVQGGINSSSLPSTTTVRTETPVKVEADASPTSSSASAQQIIYSVSRIPIVPTSSSINAITPPQKYKLPNKVSPAGETTTTKAPLTFAEEWSLTDVFHTGPQGRADCACGKVPFKVDDADKAGINQYPWTVAIVKTGLFGGGRVSCGGSLINDKYVITTSNCMDGTFTDGIQVWLTAHNTFQTELFVQEDRILKRDVVEILMHPNYNRQTNENDIALVKLGKPVDISISSYYVPICLPAVESTYVGLNAKMASWGTGGVYNGRVYNSKICREDVPVISNDVCNRDTRHSGKITTNMMCAGLLTPNYKESCLADSGGPLMIQNGGRHALIGVISWGFNNRQAYSPIVYSKVAGYSDWILHNTRDADWCGS